MRLLAVVTLVCLGCGSGEPAPVPADGSADADLMLPGCPAAPRRAPECAELEKPGGQVTLEPASCYAPPSAAGRWKPRLVVPLPYDGRVFVGRDRVVVGDGHRVFPDGESYGWYLSFRRGAGSWVPDAPTCVVEGLLHDLAIDGAALATSFQSPLGPSVVRVWEDDSTSECGTGTRVALSGGTLLVTGPPSVTACVRAGGAWKRSPLVPDTRDQQIAAVGFDRFALSSPTRTRIVWRNGDAWTELGAFGPSAAVAMSAGNGAGAFVALTSIDPTTAAGRVDVLRGSDAGWKPDVTLRPTPGDRDAAAFGRSLAALSPTALAVGGSSEVRLYRLRDTWVEDDHVAIAGARVAGDGHTLMVQGGTPPRLYVYEGPAD
jgi:hypothetical protein